MKKNLELVLEQLDYGPLIGFGSGIGSKSLLDPNPLIGSGFETNKIGFKSKLNPKLEPLFRKESESLSNMVPTRTIPFGTL